jgi:aryl-alcohol dehydrogenase-like predicted oxidoreductase
MSLPTSKLGTTGLEISRVGLGNWAIGGARGEWGWGTQADDLSVRTIHAAVHAGVNWIDTAASYGVGHAEKILGAALRTMPPSDRPLIFTKCGLVWDGQRTLRIGRPDALRAELVGSLQRLGTEVVDLYQLHWPPQDGTDIADSWGALVQMRAEGLIRYAGVSNIDAAQLVQLEGIGHVDTVQPPLSLLQRGALAHLIPKCHSTGTGVLVYSPMQSGLLTGKYDHRAVAALAADDWRSRDSQFRDPALSRTLALVAGLREVAAGCGLSLQELAVAWTLAQPGVTAAIVGTRSPDQIADWIGAGGVRLDAATLQRIRQILVATDAGTGPYEGAVG